MATERDAENAQPSLRFGYYVVCVIDLLGQAQKLQGWSELPRGQDRPPAFIQALRDSVGVVSHFKRTFAQLFAQFAETNLSANQVASMTPAQRQSFSRFKNCSLGIQQFSDTFIFYAPLMNDHGDVTSTPLYRILAACSIAMLTSLAAKVPLRGGVCLGAGTELEPGNFYGPALARAHHIESRIARYPRVVVANEVVQLVQGTTGFSQEPAVDSVMATLTQACGRLICPDADGHAIVDFLGPGIREVNGRYGVSTTEPIGMAYNFVQSQVEHFEKVGNVELTGRYCMLRRYMKERLPLWGLSPEEVGHG